MAKFNKNYQKPSSPPNSFECEIINPEGKKRVFPLCTIYNGVVVMLETIGKGKKTEKVYWSEEGDADVVEEWQYYAYVPRPIYLVATATEAEKAEINAVDAACGKKEDYTECFVKFNRFMPRMGQYLGYSVRDMKDVRNEQIRLNKKLTLYAGFRGLKMLERVPPEVWAKIKTYATFYKKEEVEDYYEDTDDFGRVDNARDEAGWNYGTGVIPVLLALGYELTYRSNPVTKLEDIEEIDKRLFRN